MHSTSHRARLEGLLHRVALRDHTEQLRRRFGRSRHKDALLLEMALDGGNSYGVIARFSDRNESSVRRRVHRLIGRLDCPESLTVLRRQGLSALQVSVARAYFMEGFSQPQIVRRTGLTPYYVKKTLAWVRRLSRRSGSAARHARPLQQPGR